MGAKSILIVLVPESRRGGLVSLIEFPKNDVLVGISNEILMLLLKIS